MLHNQMILKCIIYFWDIKENQFLSNERYHLYVKLKKFGTKTYIYLYIRIVLCVCRIQNNKSYIDLMKSVIFLW